MKKKKINDDLKNKSEDKIDIVNSFLKALQEIEKDKTSITHHHLPDSEIDWICDDYYDLDDFPEKLPWEEVSDSLTPSQEILKDLGLDY